MRATAAFSHLRRLEGIHVRAAAVVADTVVVTVTLRPRRLRCPASAFATRTRYDTRPVLWTWHHLELGVWRLKLRAGLRRLDCPTHGVRTEAVPFARPGSRHTRDLEDLVGYLATAMDRTAIGRLLRLDWDTVGRICTRVMADRLDPRRLEGLLTIGVDEVSWRRRPHYLTLLSHHRRGRIVWGQPGKDAATRDTFFDELGADRAAQLTAVSMDMSPAFETSARAPGHATNAVICYDPIHVVALGTQALDTVRRQVWQEMRGLDADAAHRFRGARWCLLKNPENLNDDQAVTLCRLRRRGGALWRAYGLKEALRAIFAGDLDVDAVADLLDRFCAKAQRSGPRSFVTVAKTIRRRRADILAAIRLGITNAQHEGVNRRVRLIINRAYGFHSAKAALALVVLTVGPITHVLPHERAANP
ncbi:MAG TPA: ISL3 family transposase [Candidatus Micrarchaeia archaeon]|nr:ISL3 family transposase [Candidatus Micrarchaeia archaeon]